MLEKGSLELHPALGQPLRKRQIEGRALFGKKIRIATSEEGGPEKDSKKLGSLTPSPALPLSTLPPPLSQAMTARGAKKVPKLSFSSTRPPTVRKTRSPRKTRS